MPLALATISLLGGCGQPARTELAAGDFTPTQTLRVTSAAFPRDVAPSCPGDVIVLVNAGDDEARFRSPPFDTGRLRAGDQTVIVLVEPGEHQWRSIAPDATGEALDEGEVVGSTPVRVEPEC